MNVYWFISVVPKLTATVIPYIHSTQSGHCHCENHVMLTWGTNVFEVDCDDSSLSPIYLL